MAFLAPTGGLGIIWVLRAAVHMCKCHAYRIAKEELTIRVQKRHCTYVQQVVEQPSRLFPDKTDMLEIYPHNKRRNI